jgi:uncharacterized protein (UPF0335 family)
MKTTNQESTMSESARTVAISAADVKSYFQKLSTAKQTVDDARMRGATLWQDFEEQGGNRAAMKFAMKLAKQDAAKSADWQHHFDFYKETLGLNDQFDMYEEPEAAGPAVIDGDARTVA